MDIAVTEAIRAAQDPVQLTPYPPRIQTTLYLYDQAEPTFHVTGLDRPHVTVCVESEGMTVRMAAWSPSTLRRYAAVCMAAADQLDAALDVRAEVAS